MIPSHLEVFCAVLFRLIPFCIHFLFHVILLYSVSILFSLTLCSVLFILALFRYVLYCFQILDADLSKDIKYPRSDGV